MTTNESCYLSKSDGSDYKYIAQKADVFSYKGDYSLCRSMIGDSTSESSVDKLRSMIGDSTSGDRMVWRNCDSTRRIESLHTRLLSTYSLPAGADTPVSRSRSYSENRNDLSENRKRFKRRDSDSGIQDSFQIRRSSSLRDSIDLLYKKQRDARVDKVAESGRRPSGAAS